MDARLARQLETATLATLDVVQEVICAHYPLAIADQVYQVQVDFSRYKEAVRALLIKGLFRSENELAL